MIVFVVRFCFVTTAFSGAGTAENPRGARWAGGFVCPLWDLDTLKPDDGYLLFLALAKAFRSFPGDFRVGFCVSPGCFWFFSRVDGSVLFRVVSFPLFGLVVAPFSGLFLSARSGRVFFCLVSCILHFSL